jgi:hypothetical protein
MPQGLQDLIAKKIVKNLKEYKSRKPLSNGKVIKSKKQAIAIGISEAKALDKKMKAKKTKKIKTKK